VSFVFLSIILRKEQHKHERCYYIYHVALLCSISSVTSRSWQSICMLQEKGTWMSTEPRTKLVNTSVSPNGRGELVTSAIAVVMMSGIGCVVSPIPSLINLAFGFFWMCSCSRMDIWLRGPEEWKQSVNCQWLRSMFRIKKKKRIHDLIELTSTNLKELWCMITATRAPQETNIHFEGPPY
jgi:hypothetical protein